jgi:hypothetical protein
MRRLNVKQANTRRERIARNVEKLHTKHQQEDFKPNITPRTSLGISLKEMFDRAIKNIGVRGHR